MYTIQEIKSYMREKKITQDELSQKSGITIWTIKSIFSGRVKNPRIDTMNAIEKALGLDDQNSQSETDKLIQELTKHGLTIDLLRNLSSSDADLLVKMAKKLAGKE